jgi:hypothetical protein
MIDLHLVHAIAITSPGFRASASARVAIGLRFMSSLAPPLAVFISAAKALDATPAVKASTAAKQHALTVSLVTIVFIFFYSSYCPRRSGVLPFVTDKLIKATVSALRVFCHLLDNRWCSVFMSVSDFLCVFRRIFLEVLQAVLAAKLHFFALMLEHARLPHAVELFARPRRF